jgi:hypothetical protein
MQIRVKKKSLLYLGSATLFPSPALAKAGDGMVCGV